MGAYLLLARRHRACCRPGRACRLRPHPRAAARGGDRLAPGRWRRRGGALRRRAARCTPATPRRGRGAALLARRRRPAPLHAGPRRRALAARSLRARPSSRSSSRSPFPYAAVVLAERGGPSRDAAFGRRTRGCRGRHPSPGLLAWRRRRRRPSGRGRRAGRLPSSGCAGARSTSACATPTRSSCRRSPTFGSSASPCWRRAGGDRAGGAARLRADRALAATARRLPPHLGPARRPGLGLGDARRHPRRRRPRRPAAHAGPARRTAPISSAIEAALQAQAQHDDDGAEERELGDRPASGRPEPHSAARSASTAAAAPAVGIARGRAGRAPARRAAART